MRSDTIAAEQRIAKVGGHHHPLRRIEAAVHSSADVAALLAGDLPSQFLEGGDHLPRPEQRYGAVTSHRDFDFARLHRQRHPSLGSNFQAGLNRFADVGLGLAFGCPLADAAGDGRAFGDECSVFVLRQGNEEFHFRSRSVASNHERTSRTRDTTAHGTFSYSTAPE